MSDIDERDLQHGWADTEQSEIEKQRNTITELQAQLAERDKGIAELHNALHERDQVILEQQARIAEMLRVLRIAQCALLELSPCASETCRQEQTQSLTVAVTLLQDLPHGQSISALESALKAERIKTLEDAAEHLDGFPIRVVGDSAATQNDCIAELRRMANELKK